MFIVAASALLLACGSSGSGDGDGDGDGDLCERQSARVSYSADENGIDWNGAHWNGAHWNGAHWNGAHWNGAHWNGVAWDDIEWNGIGFGAGWDSVDFSGTWQGSRWSDVSFSGSATEIPWNDIDYTGLDFNAVDWDDISWPAPPVHWDQVRWDAPAKLAFADDAFTLAVWMTGTLCDEPVGTFALANPSLRAWLNDYQTTEQLLSKLHVIEVIIEAAAGANVPVLLGQFPTGDNGELVWHTAMGRSGVGMSGLGTGPGDVAHQERITAHLAAKVNAFGALPISLRVDGVNSYETTAAEAMQFIFHDSDSFGNLFIEDGFAIVMLNSIGVLPDGGSSDRELRYGCERGHGSGFCAGGTIYVTQSMAGDVSCRRGEFSAASSCTLTGDSHGPYDAVATVFVGGTFDDSGDAGPGGGGGDGGVGGADGGVGTPPPNDF